MRAAVDDQTLLRWLDNQPDQLERYLDKHPDAVDRLEELTALPASVGSELERAVTPAPDFPARMVKALHRDPSARQAASMVADLLALPWRVASFVADPERAAAPRVDG